MNADSYHAVVIYNAPVKHGMCHCITTYAMLLHSLFVLIHVMPLYRRVEETGLLGEMKQNETILIKLRKADLQRPPLGWAVYHLSLVHPPSTPPYSGTRTLWIALGRARLRPPRGSVASHPIVCPYTSPSSYPPLHRLPFARVGPREYIVVCFRLFSMQYRNEK